MMKSGFFSGDGARVRFSSKILVDTLGAFFYLATEELSF
jgi:hypothetical protein